MTYVSVDVEMAAMNSSGILDYHTQPSSYCTKNRSIPSLSGSEGGAAGNTAKAALLLIHLDNLTRHMSASVRGDT